jgi:cytochrome P450/NADPH-cytochrome P450 reductase
MNAVGKETVEARVLVCRELKAAESPKRARHLEVSLPPGVVYRAGDHLGVCPKNDQERVERLARRLGASALRRFGASPDGLFMAPRTMNVRAVPKGVVLQVRKVLTDLIDITGRPTVSLLDLMLEKAADPAERSRLVEIRDVLQAPDGPDSLLRTAIDAGGYDVLRLLDESPSCSLNIFEFLRGIRSSSLDYIYRGEIGRFAAGGVLNHVHVATSRERPGRREYVQDRIRNL